ncbi:MAG TPA: hypothetical protein VF581_07710 [Flavobacterium sp.]|jgi:hypothetical protein
MSIGFKTLVFPGSGGGIGNQDNKAIVKSVLTSDQTLESVAAAINAHPGIIVSETEELYIIAIPRREGPLGPRPRPANPVFRITIRGKGTYGDGGTELFAYNLLQVGSTALYSDMIENAPGTQTINFEDIEGDAVWDHLNAQNPAINIQDQNQGYVLVKTTEGNYLFVGAGGVYGNAATQSTESDFEALSDALGGVDLASILAAGHQATGERGHIKIDLDEGIFRNTASGDISDGEILNDQNQSSISRSKAGFGNKLKFDELAFEVEAFTPTGSTKLKITPPVPAVAAEVKVPAPLTSGIKFLATEVDGVAATINGKIVSVPQITITLAGNITTDTLDANGLSQFNRNVVLDNGAVARNVTVNGTISSYIKTGSAAITFVQGAGRTLVLVAGTAIMNGIAGSTASITSVGTTDYLRISNA